MLPEYQRSKLAHRFRQLDADDNGYLEPDDFTALARRVCDQLIPARDANGRRAVREGYQHMWQHLAAVADANSDGRISLEEYQAAVERNLVSDPQVYQNSVVRIITAAFNALDTDSDGRLTEAELVRLGEAVSIPRADAAVLFAKLDANKAGKISLAQLLDAARDFWQGHDPGSIGNFVVGQVR